MTRINCIPAEELHDKHLIAEYRELPRIFKLAQPGVEIPDKYVLGTGHMKFFYNKLLYLCDRQEQLVSEMKRRGFKPAFDPKSLRSMTANKHHCLYNGWVPTEEAQALNRARITARLISMGEKI